MDVPHQAIHFTNIIPNPDSTSAQPKASFGCPSLHWDMNHTVSEDKLLKMYSPTRLDFHSIRVSYEKKSLTVLLLAAFFLPTPGCYMNFKQLPVSVEQQSSKGNSSCELTHFLGRGNKQSWQCGIRTNK